LCGDWRVNRSKITAQIILDIVLSESAHFVFPGLDQPERNLIAQVTAAPCPLDQLGNLPVNGDAVAKANPIGEV